MAMVRKWAENYDRNGCVRIVRLSSEQDFHRFRAFNKYSAMSVSRYLFCWGAISRLFCVFSEVIRLPSLETNLDATTVDFSGGPVVPEGMFDSLLPWRFSFDFLLTFKSDETTISSNVWPKMGFWLDVCWAWTITQARVITRRAKRFAISRNTISPLLWLQFFMGVRNFA